MDQGILGSIAKYDELTFRGQLGEGFTWGAIEATARQDTSASADNGAIQKSRIAQLNAQYGETNLKLVVPTCNSETVWKLENKLTSRLQSFRQSDNLHSLSHASYFLIGYAAGLFYGSSPDDLVNDRICQINLCFRDGKVREHALFAAIKQLPVQDQTVESFLRALKQTLHSCHSRVTILFLAACPDSAVKIRSDKEHRILEETLQHSTFSDAYQLYDVKSCKPRDITAALRKYKPSILHFSGHASRDGLVFENELGGFDFIETKSLALVMKQGAKDGLRTVVLNACSTAEQSDCIANIVGCVIAMKDAVNDDACIDFMRAFYNSLAEGHGIEDAFDWGLAESHLLYRPDMIRPLLIKGGTKSKKASEDAQKSSNQVLSKRKMEVSSTQSTAFVDNPNNDGKIALTEAEVDEEESEATEDEDENEFASKIEAPRNADWSSHDAKTISKSPSKVAAASENPPASENALALKNASASEDALASGKVQASGSTPVTKEPVSKMSRVVSPTNTASEEKPPASENAPATMETASKIGGTPSAVNMSPSASEQLSLSMIERLKLRCPPKKNEHDGGQKEAESTNDPVLAQKPSASPRPIPNAQIPRQPSSQAGNAPKLRDTDPSGRSGAAASAGRPKHSLFHEHPLFDDPFFLGGSIFNDMMFDGFFGPRRSAPPQARPAQGRGSNATTPRGEISRAQLPPCDICKKPLTMEGSLTCISCTKGMQIACATCAPKLRCFQEKHDVRPVEFQVR